MSISNFAMELVDQRVMQERDAAVSRIQKSLKPSMATECQHCGDPIGKARISAMPSTTLCIHCAEDLERS